MSDARSQLEEVDALIAADPTNSEFQQLRNDLLQLIALEEQESAGEGGEAAVEDDTAAQPSGAGTHTYDEQSQPVETMAVAATSESLSEQKDSSSYTAQGTFLEHVVVSKEAIAEAPDLGAFQPVTYSSKSKTTAAATTTSQPAIKSNGVDSAEASANLTGDSTNANATTTTSSPPEKKKKKKKKSDSAVLEAKFELPSHLVPLDSDTPAQKLKKQRTAKALKSKFRGKQKEAEHAKRQNDWKSFATKGKKRKGAVGGSSIFATDEGVNARVGVVSGGGGRKMTDFADQNKRHKF